MYGGGYPGAGYPGAPMPGAYPGAPMPGAYPGAPMPGAYPGAPMPMPGAYPGGPMPVQGPPGMARPGYPGAPMPGYPGAPMPGMPCAPMPGMPGAPMAGGFPTGYPIFSGQIGANMYYKPVWTPKREAKLARVWYEIARDGCITFHEIIKLLDKFHYKVSPYEAQWFFNTLDVNHDGRIDYPEVRAAMQQFIMTYPRYRNPAKSGRFKPWYQPGYNWRSHPGFPMQYGHLWRF